MNGTKTKAINEIQNTFHVGTCQAVIQYFIKQQKIDLKLLPYEFNMSCMLKKEILGDDMLHTKLGHVSHYNGLPEKEKSVPYWMEKTYKYLYG